jgi:hypothetical protein
MLPSRRSTLPSGRQEGGDVVLREGGEILGHAESSVGCNWAETRLHAHGENERSSAGFAPAALPSDMDWKYVDVDLWRIQGVYTKGRWLVNSRSEDNVLLDACRSFLARPKRPSSMNSKSERPVWTSCRRGFASVLLTGSIGLLCASALFLSGTSVAADTPQAKEIGAMPVAALDPEAARSVLGKLVRLVSVKEGYVDRQAFEHTFGMRFVESDPVGMNGTAYEVHRGHDWLLDASLVITNFQQGSGLQQESGLIVTFRKNAGTQIGSSPELCIPTKEAVDGLRSNGWIGGDSLAGPFVTLKRAAGLYFARVFASGGCLINLTVAASDGHLTYKH